MSDYDVIVLGGGSAGTTAARAATAAGARTLMINDGELGGLCILRGCMPTKAMLASAHLMHDVRMAEPLGLRFEGRMVPDFAAIMQRKDGIVARLKRAKIDSIEAGGYEVLDARARFAPGGGIEAGGRRLSAGGYVIATGSSPGRLPLPGIEHARVLTSDDVMLLDRQPASLVVQGAGAIGLELAQFFARIGTRVTLVNRSDLLTHFDPEAGEALRGALAKEPNLTLRVPGAIVGIEPDGDGANYSIRADGEEHRVRADALLMATGRRPTLDGLGLEHLGLLPTGGRIDVDHHLETTSPGVFVAGDALGTFLILHIANQEGRVAGENAAGRRPRRVMDYRLKMECIFTDPPFAYVGRTDVEVRREPATVVSAIARFPETGRAITMGVRHGAWKLFADARTGEIVGSCIVGPRADDLIHVVSAIMAYRGKVSDLHEMPWYHPTLSEVVVDLVRGIERQIGEPGGGPAVGGAGADRPKDHGA